MVAQTGSHGDAGAVDTQCSPLANPQQILACRAQSHGLHRPQYRKQYRPQGDDPHDGGRVEVDLGDGQDDDDDGNGQKGLHDDAQPQ